MSHTVSRSMMMFELLNLALIFVSLPKISNGNTNKPNPLRILSTLYDSNKKNWCEKLAKFDNSARCFLFYWWSLFGSDTIDTNTLRYMSCVKNISLTLWTNALCNVIQREVGSRALFVIWVMLFCAKKTHRHTHHSFDIFDDGQLRREWFREFCKINCMQPMGWFVQGSVLIEMHFEWPN